MVSGHFEGSIRAQRLEIVATGQVSGSISVQQLVIESGAQFNGNSEVLAAGAGVKPEPELADQKAKKSDEDSPAELKAAAKKAS